MPAPAPNRSASRLVHRLLRAGITVSIAVPAAACGSSGNKSQSAGGGGSANSGGNVATGGSTSTGGASNTGGATSSGGSAGSAGSTSVTQGGPGCGLASAAFCDTFDAPSPNQGRAGELDAHFWSAGRLAPQLPTGNGVAIGIGPATLTPCRSGLPAQVSPDQDTLICDSSTDIASSHLLVAVAAQNYGQNSYRIRQPFDFAGRTGTIVFDAEGYQQQLLGWVSVEVTEDPINAPSFAVGAAGIYNDEGSLVPRNAIEVQFENTCAGYATPPSFSMRMLNVFHDYVDTTMAPNTPVCLPTQQGKLNHFEISISQTHIEIRATPFSSDGKTFDTAKLLYAADVNLPFSRGYVQISTHNHATIKYSPNNALDSWIAHWDNVGFDGPVVKNWREVSVPDALTPGTNAWNRGGPVVSMGYRVADVSNGPKQTLHLDGVDLTGVKTARLSVSTYYNADNSQPTSGFVLKYRFNGGSWHDRPLTAGELGVLTGGNCQGTLGEMIDVALSDLKSGNNTLEFVTSGVPQNYPPAVANIDLVLSTQ